MDLLLKTEEKTFIIQNKIGVKMSENMTPKSNQDVLKLLEKMQYQLDSMEKKIDSIFKQTKPKSFGTKSFSKFNKDGNEAKRFGARKYPEKKDEPSSEGKFYHGRPFGKSKDSSKSNFKGAKRPSKKSFKKI